MSLALLAALPGFIYFNRTSYRTVDRRLFTFEFWLA
jgi:hypothetical protein